MSVQQDLEKTKHYTTKAAQICSNLIKFIPQDANLVEPFVGNGDLLALFPNHKWELYDIESHPNSIKQDTLLAPPNYTAKWVITNPPYLAKNKANNKVLFNKYELDDLYKISMLTMLDSEGGILIIPTNFFTDENSEDIRKKFLNIFEIDYINIFTEPVFETTTYSVCSFAFHRKNQPNTDNQNLHILISPAKKEFELKIEFQYGYRIAGEFYKVIDSISSKFNRLIGPTSNENITHLKLYALDTRTSRIRLEYEETPYIGKVSDRSYATLTCKMNLTKDQELKLIDKFNKTLEEFRNSYGDISLTNYRDYNRKRIGFTFAYKLLTKIYNELYGSC